MRRGYLWIAIGVAAVLVAGTFTKIFIKNIVHAKTQNANQTITESINETITAISDELDEAGSEIKTSSEIVEDTVAISEFEKLEVDVASINTYIKYGDEYKLEYRVLEENVPVVDQDGDTLSIEQPSHVFGVNFSFDGYGEQFYRITVPKDTKILDVDLDATSGKMSVEDVDIKGKIKLTSGDLILKDIDSDKLSITMTSGDANIENLAVNDLDIDMTSGSMDLELAGSEDDYSYKLEATSGDFRLGDKKIDKEYRSDDKKDKKITAEMTSGNLKITFTK